MKFKKRRLQFILARTWSVCMLSMCTNADNIIIQVVGFTHTNINLHMHTHTHIHILII